MMSFGLPESFSVLGLAVVAIGWLRLRAQSKTPVPEFEIWQGRLKTLDPVIDVEDDGHLQEWLDPPQWEAVFSELERTPKESRSLRNAIEKIAPGTV